MADDKIKETKTTKMNVDFLPLTLTSCPTLEVFQVMQPVEQKYRDGCLR